MRKLVVLALALFFCTHFGSPVGAQTQTPTDSGTTIRATANEVLLDLVVRDKHRKLVKNLKPGEVQILEDGVPQKILSFRLTDKAEPQTEPEAKGKSAKAAPAHRKPAPHALRKVNLICIVFHNQDNLDPTMKKFRLDAVQEFLNGQMQPDTWIGVFNLGVRLSVLHPFSNNRADLLRAVANNFSAAGTGTFQLAKVADAVMNGTPNLDVIEGFSNGHLGIGGGIENLQTGKLNPHAITGVDTATGLGADTQRGDIVGQQRQFGGIDGQRQTDQMKLMIQELGVLPGHKTVLLLSPGLSTTGDPDFFQPVLNGANKANITVYALDTNGLSENSNVQAANQALQHVVTLSQKQAKPMGTDAGTTTTGSVGAEAELMRQDDYLHHAVRTSDTQAPLRNLAEGTGGFLIANTNDFRKPFQKLFEDVAAHYEAVYHPNSDKYDGSLRKIEVKLTRPDLTVETRTGYFAMPDVPNSSPLTPLEMAGLMMLSAQPAPHAFDFRAASLQFRPGTESSDFAVTYEVPVSGMTATPDPARKSHHIHVSLVALVKDSKGQVVDRFSQDQPYEIPDDRLAGLQTTSIPYSHLLSLPPGRYTVDTAIIDLEGSRASTNSVAIENSEGKGVGLSSVMLVKELEPATGQPDMADPFRVGNNRVTPELSNVVKAGIKPFIYFVVYRDKASAETPRVEIQFLRDGQVQARRSLDVPPPDATGASPMMISSVAQPGDCELKITATQGAQSFGRTVKYTVAAN